MKKYLLKSNQGTTLLELIIAVSVFSISLLTLYMVIIYGITVNRQAKNLAMSYEVASKEVETIRNTPYAALVDQTDGNFYSDSTADLVKLPDGQGKLTIENYNDNDKIKKITVIVTWTDKGQTKTTTMSTLATEGGINR